MGAIWSNAKVGLQDKYSYTQGTLDCSLVLISTHYWCIACFLGVFLGFLGGTIISLAVGYSIASIIEDVEEDVDGGVEAGEGASKLIAFLFVLKLAMKLPKWFEISNYKEETPSAAFVIDASPVPSDVEKAETTVVYIEEKSELEALELDSKWSMFVSLLWNTLRESTEAGVFVALVVLLAEEDVDLGGSVGVGIAGAAGGAIIMGLGAKYVSQLGFGVVSTVLASLLAVGLITGAVRAFEEVYDIEHGYNTGIIYNYEDTETGDVLEALGFAGFGKELTVITLVTWLFSAASIAAAQFWKHYLGFRLAPRFKCSPQIAQHEKVPPLK